MKTTVFLSTAELAKSLGISRIAVFKRIKRGDIPVQRVGRSYLVPKSFLPELLGSALRETRKREIETAVRRTVREYGEALRLLGQE